MISIKDFMELIEYRITDGSTYQWKCYGRDTHYLAYEKLETGTTINIIFDTVTHVVYEMQAWDGPKDKEYRWIHPSFRDKFEQECIRRKISLTQSVDNRNFTDLEVSEDMLEKASAIYKEIEYDPRVLIELTMAKEDIHRYMEMAHKKDMTLNQYIEDALRKYLEEQGIKI